jgi:hypothetical protein
MLDQQLVMMLQALMLKKTISPTRFKMVSPSGVTSVKQSIDTALDATGLRGKISIVMETPPQFIITSNDETIDETHHTAFKAKLTEIGKDCGITIE